jgi:hypothetical protein
MNPRFAQSPNFLFCAVQLFLDIGSLALITIEGYIDRLCTIWRLVIRKCKESANTEDDTHTSIKKRIRLSVVLRCGLSNSQNSSSRVCISRVQGGVQLQIK